MQAIAIFNKKNITIGLKCICIEKHKNNLIVLFIWALENNKKMADQTKKIVKLSS